MFYKLLHSIYFISNIYEEQNIDKTEKATPVCKVTEKGQFYTFGNKEQIKPEFRGVGWEANILPG